MLLALLCLPIHSAPGREAGHPPGASPSVEIAPVYIYISRKEGQNHKISLTLDCFLDGAGTFTGKEGPHQLSLSDPEGTWSIPLQSEAIFFSKDDPFIWKQNNTGTLPLKPEKEIRNWRSCFFSSSFPLPPSTTRLRLKGKLFYDIAPRLHALPPFDLLLDGKGRTLDIPVPVMEKDDGAVAVSGMQDSATFTSSTPSDHVVLTLAYNAGCLPFTSFLLLDRQERPAQVSPMQCSLPAGNTGTREYTISQQFQSSEDWSKLQVQLLYLGPEEAQSVAVPVDMEISLAAPSSGVRRSHEPSPAPPAPGKTLHPPPGMPPLDLKVKSIKQNKKNPSRKGGIQYGACSTTIELHPATDNDGPILSSLSPEGSLNLKGDVSASVLPPSTCLSTDLTFSEKGPQPPFISLCIPELLPPASSCWTLSGTMKATMASHAFQIEVPLPLKKGETVNVPLNAIPSGLLGKNEKITLTVADVISKKPGRETTLLVHLRSTLPPENFGALTLLDERKLRYSPSFRDKVKRPPQGVTATYEALWYPHDRQITAELVLYIHPHTVLMPLHLKFGAGGAVPSPDDEPGIPPHNKTSQP